MGRVCSRQRVKLWVIWVIVLLGLAPWRGGAAAQAPLAQPQAAISGQITVNVNGTVMPEPRVTVELRDATGEAVLASTVTDANGRYQFTGRTGIFYVIPRKSVFEFTPVRDRVIVVVFSGRDFCDDTANFTISCRRSSWSAISAPPACRRAVVRSAGWTAAPISPAFAPAIRASRR